MNDSKTGAYATREEAERAIAEMEANRCPCGGIDLHLTNYPGPHWHHELGRWVGGRGRRDVEWTAR